MAKKKVTEAVAPAVGDFVVYEAGTLEKPEQWSAEILAIHADGRADLKVSNGSYAGYTTMTPAGDGFGCWHV
jgi:hypothetical protein